MKNEKDEVVDESGNEQFKMNIDTETYPVDYITEYDEYLACKPPKKTKGKLCNEK